MKARVLSSRLRSNGYITRQLFGLTYMRFNATVILILRASGFGLYFIAGSKNDWLTLSAKGLLQSSIGQRCES